MKVLGNYVLVSVEFKKKRSRIITDNNPENKSLYEEPIFKILQLGTEVPKTSPLNVGQTVLLSTYATTPEAPVLVSRINEDGDKYMEAIYRADDVRAIIKD